MNAQELLFGGGGVLLVLLTLVEIAPLKINPWSRIGRAVGKALNGNVMEKLDELEARLENHVRMDDERNADLHRARILQFNNELLRDIRHTEEDFNETMYNIDCYERYCAEHPGYQNNRAVHAIRHINNVYDIHMEQHDFL